MGVTLRGGVSCKSGVAGVVKADVGCWHRLPCRFDIERGMDYQRAGGILQEGGISGQVSDGVQKDGRGVFLRVRCLEYFVTVGAAVK